MKIPKFNILPMTEKEKLGNDLNVLCAFINASHEYISEELLEATKNEAKRIAKLYQEAE